MRDFYKRRTIGSRIPILQRFGSPRKFNITHCIFDLDGTLINSEEIHQVAIKEIMTKYKLKYGPELRASTLGRTAEDACKVLVTDGKVPLPLERCIKIFEAKTSRKLAKCKLMPGVEKLITHLYNHNIPLALVTTSTEEEIDLKLSAFGCIRRMFHHEIVGASDKSVGKKPPFPDLFFTCAERFCTDCINSNTLVFDDAPIGIRAAYAAGMKIVLVQSMQLPRSVIRCANVVIPTLEEFKPENFGFPKYDS